ncbi:hypothetical protein RJ639_028505 [Escallonia herrerae]|uniref:Retrovirus-related Pol polyprotein from transposon TNT 1-94 n=1 Tax=Escallonia herrerae TaxID=1293975 RepID=A0AA88X492_9ASTE|nr:hypothetical protein RJ639_028505 [Escallonia herrerae]
MNTNRWAILDRKVLATVRLSMTLQVAFNISKEKTTTTMMEAFEKLYQQPFPSNKVFFMKKLFNMRMFENGSIDDHLNDFDDVTNQLKSVDNNFDDEIRALLFMCSVIDSWNNLVTIVINSTVFGMLTLNDVVSSMMNDEMRTKTIGDAISSTVDADRGGGVALVEVGNGSTPMGQVKEHEIKKENREYMELDEPEDGQAPSIENPEVLDETTYTKIGAGDQQQVPETPKLRRSSRVRKAPDRLYFPLNYVLYTDSGLGLGKTTSWYEDNQRQKIEKVMVVTGRLKGFEEI